MNQDIRNNKQVSVAPMMDWTDRHCRYFHRLISPHTRLYTEMVTTGALIHGDRERFLRFDKAEHPIALQLGGSDPQALAVCAKMGEDHGYDEINLNCGCPSDRVQNGGIGACMMLDPDNVARCIEAMKEAVTIPVTIKCRIGIDEDESYEFLDRFIGKTREAGCKTYILHARSAWLHGLSPKENREVPALNYSRVYEMKSAYPELTIIVNGGIKTAQETAEHIRTVDGVMIGREAYQNPWVLADIEEQLFGNYQKPEIDTIIDAMAAYAQDQADRYGTPVKSVTRHMMGLFQGTPGAKRWRRALSTLPYEAGADHRVFAQALAYMK